MIELSSSDSHASEPEASLGSIRYVISPVASFGLVDHECVEIQTREVRTRISLDAYRLIAEFRVPRTPAEVYSSAEIQVSFREFLDFLSEYVSSLILVPAVEEQLRERAPSELFKDEFLADRSLMDRVGSALRRGSLCVILDAFRDEVAEAVHGSLRASDAWTPHEGSAGYFHYRHHNIFDRARLPEPVEDCRRALASPATKSLVERLSGEDCGGDLVFGASLYVPGDYSLPHHDLFKSRSVAYVWHLTKDWDPSWGGHLVWCSTATSLNPTFNTLILFRVTPQSYHFVTPVAPRAQGRRLTINGWWTRGGEEPGGSLAAEPSGDFYSGPTALEELGSRVYASPVVSLDSDKSGSRG